MSKDSLSNKLASAVFATSLVVSPVGAMAGEEPSDPQNNNISRVTQEMSEGVAAGWEAARKRSDYIKHFSANIKRDYEYAMKNNKTFSPPALDIVNVVSPFTKDRISFKEMRGMVNEYANIGLIGTFIGVVVEKNDKAYYSKSQMEIAETIRKQAIKVAVESSENGGNINGVYMVYVDPKEKHTGVKQGSIMVYMGDSYVSVYDSMDDAEGSIKAMFALNWHTRLSDEIDANLEHDRASLKRDRAKLSEEGFASTSTNISLDL